MFRLKESTLLANESELPKRDLRENNNIAQLLKVNLNAFISETERPYTRPEGFSSKNLRFLKD